MVKNSDYWKSRMQALENTQYEKSLEYYEDLKEQFRQALNGMQMDIELWYRRLAENNDISYAAAKRLLKSKEQEEFKWTVEQYIQAGEENAVDQRWMKQLENASARHHISYLEAMKLQAQQYAEVLYTQFEGGITDYLTKNFAEQFYHTAFEISKGVGIGFNLARLDTKAIDTAIRKPWAMDDKNFSDRIWENKDKLVRNLHTELSQCIIRGTDSGKAISSLAKKMNVSKSQAGNLIMTEMAAISATAQKKCFEELGVEEYEFDATLDGKTCEVCGRMDHKVFRMTDYQVGVTAPPIHPRCRCDTSPYFDDWEEFGIHVQRAARDPETGKTVYVDGNLNYEEWYADNIKLYTVFDDSDFMGYPKAFSDESGKVSVKAYKINGYENIYSQTHTKYAQDTILMVNAAKKEIEGMNNLNEIVIAKNLPGIAAYDHINNRLYVNEKLSDAKYIDENLSKKYFVAENAMDILTHEMNHKKHWDFVAAKALTSGEKDGTVKKILETKLHRYVQERVYEQPNYISQYVSRDAENGFLYDHSLNELIAEVLLLSEKGIKKDQFLLKLVGDIFYDDAHVR